MLLPLVGIFLEAPWSLLYALFYLLIPCFILSTGAGLLSALGAFVGQWISGGRTEPGGFPAADRVLPLSLGGLIGGLPLWGFLSWVCQSNAIVVALILLGACVLAVLLGGVTWLVVRPRRPEAPRNL
ncbi:hypothetical protein [Leucobacter iarius]|uniref:Uncharacterized protein n=1 Tax=Leucobacter iarius TaxID=333963 RepID=A0ABN2L8A1_9MICO